MPRHERWRAHKGALAYFSAPVVVAIATLLRIGLAPVVGSSTPFVTYFGAALLLAWFLGFGPAALSIVLSTLRLNRRSAFDEFIQIFQNFWIAGPGVGVSILFLLP